MSTECPLPDLARKLAPSFHFILAFMFCFPGTEPIILPLYMEENDNGRANG